MDTGLDLMRTVFPGDLTAHTTVTEVAVLHIRAYAQQVLFRDARWPLSLPPRVIRIDHEHASEAVPLTFDTFCSRVDDLKYHSVFSGYDGENLCSDLKVQCGRKHSRDRENLAVFKHFSHVALAQYVRTHNQFGARPFSPEAVHFFHVFDDETAEDNWHCHFVLLSE